MSNHLKQKSSATRRMLTRSFVKETAFNMPEFRKVKTINKANRAAQHYPKQ
jgi:hypothetical protein